MNNWHMGRAYWIGLGGVLDRTRGMVSVMGSRRDQCPRYASYACPPLMHALWAVVPHKTASGQDHVGHDGP